MDAIFDRAREHDAEIKKLPLEYAGGTIGNAQRGPVAMLVRGAWGYDDDTGKLMASAPELLASCRELYKLLLEHVPNASEYSDDARFSAPMKTARAALTKARGGA